MEGELTEGVGEQKPTLPEQNTLSNPVARELPAPLALFLSLGSASKKPMVKKILSGGGHLEVGIPHLTYNQHQR